MKRGKRALCLLLAVVMVCMLLPAPQPANAEWGDGESCFVCDGYLDENNCCQGCGGVHAEDVNSDCYFAMHCKDCGECFLLVPGCAKCGRCETCCGYRCSECDEFFCDNPEAYCETCGMCEACAEAESLHCALCMECFLGEICDECGLCDLCQEELRSEGGGHCPVCGECMYGLFGEYSEDNLCPIHGDEHCINCYEEYQCEQCGECFAGEEDSFCLFCGLCADCCEQNSLDAGCASGEICVEDPDFEYHFCPECGECFCAVDACDTCGEWCQDCCDLERCDECGLCPNTYDSDLCDTCGAGGDTLSEHQLYHRCQESRCGTCDYCQTALEDTYGYIECPCCGSCPNECKCEEDCEDCRCRQFMPYASPYFTRDKMLLTVTVLDGNENKPMEDAIVYYSRDKLRWYRLGNTDDQGVVQGNVARVLNGDPASYNLQNWQISVVNRKAKGGGFVQVGDVYCVPGNDQTVTFSANDSRSYRAAGTLKLYPTDYDPSVYGSGQYDVLLTMPKRELDGIPYSLGEYMNQWASGHWAITPYYTDQLTGRAWETRVQDYFKSNQDYFGAYLVPYTGKSNLPAQNDAYYYAPLYHFEGDTMVGDYFSEGLTETIYSGFSGTYREVSLHMLRFPDVPAGTYQLFVVMPECKLFSRKVQLRFSDGGSYESQAYDHFKLRQAVRKADLDKSFFRLGFENQIVSRVDGNSETKDFIAALGGTRSPRAAFVLTYDRDTGKKLWVVNDSFAWASDRAKYTFWTPRSSTVDYVPYLLSYDVRPGYDRGKCEQSGLADYSYLGGTVKPLAGSYTGLRLWAVQNRSAAGNPDKDSYYKVKLFFGQTEYDAAGNAIGEPQPMPDNTRIRYTLEYNGRSLLYSNWGSSRLDGLRAYYYGQDAQLPASCRLGGMVNQFYYTEQTRVEDGGWITPVNTALSVRQNTNPGAYQDMGLVKNAHVTLTGYAYVEGYGPIAATRGPVKASVSWNDREKVVYVTYLFTKLDRTGMINGYGTHMVSANATLATKSKLDPSDPYIYVNGNRGSQYGVACGDEIEIRFTTAPRETVNSVTFVRNGAELDLRSVTTDPSTQKRTFVYAFTMGREDTEILVDLGWPGGVNGYDTSFLYPAANESYSCYVGEPMNIYATVGGDGGSMTYGTDGWESRGTGQLYMLEEGTGGSFRQVQTYQNTHSLNYNVDTSRPGTYTFYFRYKGVNSAAAAQSKYLTVNVMTPFRVDYAGSDLTQTILEGEEATLTPRFVDNVQPDGVTFTWSLQYSQDVNGDGDSTDPQKLTCTNLGAAYRVATAKGTTPVGTYLIRCTVKDKWGHTETLAYHLNVQRDNRYSRLKYVAAQPVLSYIVSNGTQTVTGSAIKDGTAQSLTVEAGKPLHLVASFYTLPKGNEVYYQRAYYDDGVTRTEEPVWLLPLLGKQTLRLYVSPRSGVGDDDFYTGTLNGWEGTYVPQTPGEYVLNITVNNLVTGFLNNRNSNAQSVQKIYLTVTEPTAPGTNPFVDVKPTDWYYSSVMWAVSQTPPVTNGMDATHFGPARTCIRAQVVQFLWNAAGKPEPASTVNPFVDVKPTDWYYKAVLWAVEKGITNGMDATHFGPAGTCTRAQVVRFLWNAAGKPAPEKTETPFTDLVEGAFYYDAVLWAVEKGITNGMDATHFKPADTCTRAQVVTFLMRAADLLFRAPVNVLEDQFLMYVEEKYTITDRGLVATGRVVNGRVETGDTLVLRSHAAGTGDPVPYVVKVEGIEMFHKTLDYAERGDNVGILLSGVPAALMNRGDALVGMDSTLRPLTGQAVVTGTVRVSEESISDFGNVEAYQFYYPGSDITGTVLSLPQGPLAPGAEGTGIAVGALPHAVVWYVGQELTIRLGGRIYGTFTVERIEQPD